VIQKRLVDPLALAILEGRFVDGDTVMVDAGGEDGGEVVFEAERHAVAVAEVAEVA